MARDLSLAQESGSGALAEGTCSHTERYVYIWIYVHIEREREKEREKVTQREKEQERERDRGKRERCERADAPAGTDGGG
jgi:dephospho-CoA kinase